MRSADYADHLIGQGLSEKTIGRYLRWVREADEWLRQRQSTLDDASPSEIRAYAQECVTNSHSSRGQAVAAFRHYWEMTGRSDPPGRAIPVPPAPEMVCRAVTNRQARDLVKIATGWYPEGTAVLCGMYLALRRFEIAKMEWKRFTDNLDWYTVTGKYDKTATLPVHHHLRQELGDRRDGMRYVFPGRFPGRHAVPATIGVWVNLVGETAGIPNLQPHELRHTALAVANDTTQDLRSVQTFARHSKPSTTSGYTRTTTRRLREVSDSLNYLDLQ